MEIVDIMIEAIIKNSDYNIECLELMNIRESLINAARSRQYLYLNDIKSNLCGFLTWEMQNNIDNPGKIDIGITNLIIFKTARGTYNLMRVINYLRNKYPNVASFVWEDRKRKEVIEFKQRGYYEYMAKAV